MSGLATSALSIAANISLPSLARYVSRSGLLRRQAERVTADKFRQRLRIRAPSVETRAAALSGGNHTIRVDVVDGGKGGSTDTYAVTVRTPSGAVMRSLAATRLGGGNLTVKP